MAKKPVRRHEDLIAWQLCKHLRRLVLTYIRNGPAAKDFDYHYQLRKAARFACYNTSEGFYRYRHGQFRNFLDIARSSLGEALDQIDEGLENRYFTPEQHLEMRRYCLRAVKANAALIRSWEGRSAPDGRSKTPPNVEAPRRTQRNRRSRRTTE
jgi:four helix bundle protein